MPRIRQKPRPSCTSWLSSLSLGPSVGSGKLAGSTKSPSWSRPARRLDYQVIPRKEQRKHLHLNPSRAALISAWCASVRTRIWSDELLKSDPVHDISPPRCEGNPAGRAETAVLVLAGKAKPRVPTTGAVAAADIVTMGSCLGVVQQLASTDTHAL